MLYNMKLLILNITIIDRDLIFITQFYLIKIHSHGGQSSWKAVWADG